MESTVLFLAQFARFSIRTETEVTVHTHSQTNRHLHLCPARSDLWKFEFGFVGPLASNARWAGSISDQASGPAAEPVSKLWMSSLVLTFTKSKPSTARSATHFSMSAHHISSKGPQLQFDRHVKTSFENNFFRPTGEWEKRRQRHGSVQPQTSWISSGRACFFFFSLSKPSQSMRMVLAIRLFEFRSRKDICSMYAKLLRCTVYACEAALAMGKPQESGETPRISQSAC